MTMTILITDETRNINEIYFRLAHSEYTFGVWTGEVFGGREKEMDMEGKRVRQPERETSTMDVVIVASTLWHYEML